MTDATPPLRRAVIYVRVSQDRSQGRSVDEQEADCRAVCEREGWTVAQVIEDNDVGASRWSKGARSGYERLGDELRPGDVLVTWEASRAQRDLDAYVSLRNLCVERGVLWCYSGRTYDLSLGDDRFSTGLDALLAEKSSEETRERVLRAMRANAKEGRPHGPPPYGYRRALETATGDNSKAGVTWEPHPAEAPIVAEIAERVLSGQSLRSIAADLDARRIPTKRGSHWTSKTLAGILANPTYVARRVHRGAVVGEGKWPPLLTEGAHLRLVALLSDSQRLTHRGIAPKWLLSGIARCGVCGEPVRRAQSHEKRVYSCRTGHVSRECEPVDAFIAQIVVGYLEQVAGDIPLVDDGNERAARASEEAKVLQARLDGFADAAAAGDITPTILARIEARLLGEIKAKRAEAARVTVAPVLADLAAAEGTMQARWDALSIEKRRELVNVLFSAITIHPRGKGSRRHAGLDPESIELRWRSQQS